MKRVVIIGLDGFTPDLVQRWVAEGRLPHLARLQARGALMPLCGVTPPVTYPAWTTCVTGVNPGIHGIVDFTVVTPSAYALRFLNSTDRKAPALWNILSDAGRRVCVLGVPGAYPPEPVNGILMAGFDSPVADAIDPSFVYPPSAYSSLRRWRFAEFQEHRITAGWYDAALASLLRKIDIKETISFEMLSQEPWDLFMVVFGEADTVSHHFWPLEDEQSPRRNETVQSPAHPVRQVYERLDAVVGRLAGAADEETLILVVSDHGFGGADATSLHLNNFLEAQGWLRYAGSPRNLLKRGALRWLPTRGRGRLFRQFKTLAESLESRSRFGGINWRETRAWSEELDYFPSVRLNLAGREPEGVVPAQEYGTAVETLCALLEGVPGVARALPRAEVYHGPHAEKGPDIILDLDWDSGYRYSCTRARGGPAVVPVPPQSRAGGKEAGCSGVHRNPAFLAVNRPVVLERPGLLDIAPTVLEYLGIKGPFMEGVSLLTGIPHRQKSPGTDWTCPPQKSYTRDEESLLEERMRTLGYFE